MAEYDEMHTLNKLTELIKEQKCGEAIQKWRLHMGLNRKCIYRCEDHGREISETLCGHCLENKLRIRGFKEAIFGNSDNIYSISSESLCQWLKSR